MKSFKKYVVEAVSKEVDEKELNVDKLVSAENETLATQIFESAATIVALEGKTLSGSKLEAAMAHAEFSKDAKKWITKFLQNHPNGLDAFGPKIAHFSFFASFLGSSSAGIFPIGTGGTISPSASDGGTEAEAANIFFEYPNYHNSICFITNN